MNNIKYLKDGTMVYVHEKLTDGGYIVSYVTYSKDYKPDYIIEDRRFFVKNIYDSFK